MDGGKIGGITRASRTKPGKKLRYERTCRLAAISGWVRGFPFGKSVGFCHHSAPYVLCRFYSSFAPSSLILL